MPKRVRLTERRAKQAVDGSIPYPGNVNQPDRQFKKHDQYDNWEETINHPLPDMRHDWKNDERDEIGFGIPEPWGESPTVASVKVAANKAVKLAYLLLGSKVAEDVVEDQANDFMLLGPEAMDRTLARFAKTDALYSADKEEEDDDKEEETKEAAEAPKVEAPVEDKTAAEETPAPVKEEVVVAESKGKEEEEKAAETIQEEKEEDAKKASEELAEAAAEKSAPAEDTGASEVEASETKEAATEVVAEDDDDEDDDEEDDSKEASVQTAGEMDIELTSAMDDGTVEEDTRLAGLFDDDIPAELPEPGAGKREASDKKGIKSLGGGQPKVASGDNGAADISSLWNDAPDVSSVFN